MRPDSILDTRVAYRVDLNPWPPRPLLAANFFNLLLLVNESVMLSNIARLIYRNFDLVIAA